MDTETNLLARMRDPTTPLSPAERRVADAIDAEPEAVPYASLAALARRAGVSEPTVVRFCRALGCEGYQDFKVRLAHNLATHYPYADLSVGPGAAVDDYATKVFDATLDTLVRLRGTLPTAAVERAVRTLGSARKIEFYGVGASGSVAHDAHHKFFRLMVPCVAYSDSHMQYMSAATLQPGDAVVAISHTGRTYELLQSVDAARTSGATLIAITASGSPLAERADVLIPVDVPEDTDLYTPMTSRIAHLLVIDVLALGVALHGDDRTAERLRRMKDLLRAKRLPKDGARGGGGGP